ncbi:cbb3-type cytochrome c oxidase subunit 3 [Alcanivorax sp. DP30]|uniref:cbb3-type cytochrome oxidase subunit 3 n=1 Tax=Alcanivorax sp. DP30 TaxID=2606217 RepID=UPI00136E8DAA|nr:cbb3-type cytochrome c oxidase subunit 3 [Alcanivorax sp. DP30]MZR61777.1 CcoQ/FixQ family Cbb3-type cytochrome c oxidase assembly chaperone [Alcanivorax sp. DP30]
MSYHALLTLVFFVAFIVMVGWVYRPGRKQDYEKLGEIALEEDRNHQGGEQ